MPMYVVILLFKIIYVVLFIVDLNIDVISNFRGRAPASF